MHGTIDAVLLISPSASTVIVLWLAPIIFATATTASAMERWNSKNRLVVRSSLNHRNDTMMEPAPRIDRMQVMTIATSITTKKLCLNVGICSVLFMACSSDQDQTGVHNYCNIMHSTCMSHCCKSNTPTKQHLSRYSWFLWIPLLVVQTKCANNGTRKVLTTESLLVVFLTETYQLHIIIATIINAVTMIQNNEWYNSAVRVVHILSTAICVNSVGMKSVHSIGCTILHGFVVCDKGQEVNAV